MISTKQKLITVLICFIMLLFCTGFSFFYSGGDIDHEEAKITSIGGMKGKTLGGVQAKMPDDSAKIFFESIFGVKFLKYCSFSSVDNMLAALRSGTVRAVWASDLTADYLIRNNDDLTVLIEPEEQSERLRFAMAFRPEDTVLRDSCNTFLEELKNDGRLEELTAKYINGDDEEAVTEKDMIVNSKEFIGADLNNTLYIGITGAVPPVECLTTDGEAAGFCVSLSDLLGQYLGRRVQFLVMNNETIFTELMAGRIDLVFCYGTSENHSTEFPEYIMSEGYCSMKGYCLVTLK